MGKIRVVCSDPYATDSSSDDEESVKEKKPTNGKLFVQEISVSVPTIPTTSTTHLNSPAKLKSDSPFRVEGSKSVGGGPNWIVALPARKPGNVPNMKSDAGVFSAGNRLEKLSLAQECQPDTTNTLTREDGSADANPTCINQAADITVAKNRRSLGAGKHPGLKRTTSGKWGVQIRHPIKKTQMWLGTYNTIEEATNVYNKKKLEYAPLKNSIIKHKAHCILKAKHKGKLKRERIVVKGVTVYETVSGKWGGWIRHPVSKLKTWLGSYATPEEAANAYHRKMLEFDSTYERDSVGKGSSIVQDPAFLGKVVNDACIPAYDTACSIARDITNFKRPGVKLDGSGKWGVTMQHPSQKFLLWLGWYDTPEEAADAYDKKKFELDKVLQSDKIDCYRADMENQETQSLQMETSTDVASPTVMHPEGRSMKYKGVRLTKSGRWFSQVQHPFRRIKFYLGTFNTAEEAADAFNKKRHEFDEMISLAKKQKQEGVAQARKKEKLKAKESKRVIIPKEAGKAYDKKRSLFESVVLPQSCNQQSIVGADMANQENQSLQKDTLADVASPTVMDPKGRFVKYKGVRLTKSGRWSSHIRVPFSKSKCYLGTFNTPEEAADAFNKKRHEFDRMISVVKKQKQEGHAQAHENKKLKAKKSKKVVIPDEAGKVYDSKRSLLEPVVLPQSCNQQFKVDGADMADQESQSLQRDTLADVASPTAIDPEGRCVKKYKGVRMRKSGRWTSEIRDPFSKSRLYLGSYDTAEEAAGAFNKKRCEFDKKKQESNAQAHKKKKLTEISKSKMVASPEKRYLGKPVVLSQSYNQQSEFDGVGEVIQTGLNNASSPFTFNAENSTVTLVSSQDSEGSNNNNNDKQIPRFSLASEQEISIGVINIYGQLIGEYSRLDDELWLGRPGEYDECDLDGAIGGSEDTAWDHKAPPLFLPN